jgi:DnaK suppressor protein
MEMARAKELLLAERRRLEQLLEETGAAGEADRTAANQSGDMFDSAQPLTEEGTDESVMAGVRDRLAAVERAETRLEEGTYGLSVQSGLPIPDDRLEADPAAELTVDEVRQHDEPPSL